MQTVDEDVRGVIGIFGNESIRIAYESDEAPMRRDRAPRGTRIEVGVVLIVEGLLARGRHARSSRLAPDSIVDEHVCQRRHPIGP